MLDTLRTTLQETPANIVLLIPIAYLIYDILFPRLGLAPGSPIPTSYEEAYAWKPKTHPPTILFKRYSPVTLEQYDGKKNPKILLAVNRVVFDVTAGKSFYGPGM